MTGNRRVFFILMVLAAATLPLTAVACESKRDASGVAEDYITLYVNGDFESAYDLLAEESYEKQNWDLNRYISESESTYGGPYQVEDLVFKPQGKEGEAVPFIIQGTLVPSGGGEPLVLSGEIQLVEVDGEWRVSYIEWAAVPESQVPFDMVN